MSAHRYHHFHHTIPDHPEFRHGFIAAEATYVIRLKQNRHEEAKKILFYDSIWLSRVEWNGRFNCRWRDTVQVLRTVHLEPQRHRIG
jgi:hypothetical protein